MEQEISLSVHHVFLEICHCRHPGQCFIFLCVLQHFLIDVKLHSTVLEFMVHQGII